MSNPLIIEKGIPAGNVTDKYGTQNPVYREMMRNFCDSAKELVDQTGCRNIHEVGCGEGHLTRLLAGPERNIRASDFSSQIIDKARRLTPPESGNIDFHIRSIYDLQEEDAAELLLCCEVLEHLEDPEKAVQILSGLARPYLLTSVPREPLWRILNVLRCKYVRQGGNTPGHLNHWSKNSFVRLLSRHFDIVTLKSPLPWTMVLCKAKVNSSSPGS